MNNTTFSIDEEGLLPGTSESTQMNGSLGLAPVRHDAIIKFDPLQIQPDLVSHHLKSQGTELHYTLSQEDQALIATQGVDGPPVFSILLDNNGNYTFTLLGHIDRPAPPDLVINGNLSLENNSISAWEQTTYLEGAKSPMLVLSQEISTNPGEPYQFTFHHLPNDDIQISEGSQIQVYWDNELLYTLPAMSDEEKGFTFSVEGSKDNNGTLLQFVAIGDEGILKNYINNICVTSSAQSKLPIDFGFTVQEGGDLFHHQFTVNVTTTPPIELNNSERFDVIYENAVYQTIIVNGETPTLSPTTTINLDALFKNLSIPAEDRFVEVIQREEDGLATNVYEVKISDKNHTYSPITVADVQLSFPGGDGGLPIFQRNIAIDEGNNNNPTYLNLDHII